MTKCLNLPHGPAVVGGVAVPDPDELLADINALDKWRFRAEQRNTKLAKSRQAGASIAAPDPQFEAQ